QQVARMSHTRVYARLRRAMAKSGRSRPNALRVWLASGTPSGVTSCRRLSAATDRPGSRGQSPDIAIARPQGRSRPSSTGYERAYGSSGLSLLELNLRLVDHLGPLRGFRHNQILKITR